MNDLDTLDLAAIQAEKETNMKINNRQKTGVIHLARVLL